MNPNVQFLFLTPGVLQGSHLSPLLFLHLITDISLVFIKSSILLCRDYLEVFKIVNSDEDYTEFWSDFNPLELWSSKNKHFINISNGSVSHS